MKIVTVNASASYDVLIENGLLQNCKDYLAPFVSGKTAAIVSDDRVAPLYLKGVKEQLEDLGCKVVSFVFPNGEKSKTIETYGEILGFLAQNGLTRRDVIIALGGGVVGDMAGFAAATYLRGVDYIQIPTTLLSMVDSSVGGKTAIDLPAGKNLVGAFYQPKLVLCDPQTLSTLPQEIFADGMAEVIKYGMICDEGLLSILKEGVSGRIDEIIFRCVAIKRDIVSRDERETGERKLLNFGHSIGHAVEKCSNFEISHGRCVGIGMAILTRSFVNRGLCEKACETALEELLKQYHLDDSCDFSADQLVSAMGADKKRMGKAIDLIIPTGLGKTAIEKTPMDALYAIVFAGL